MKTPTLFDGIDMTGYLRASASTFSFWDNEQDAEYDNWIAVINDEIAREDSIEWLFDVTDVDDSQLCFDLDLDAETQDLIDARMDEIFTRRGGA